jgi:antitoxin HicB
MDYPVRFERDDNNTVLVSFPDFPEAHTFGDDEADALLRAQGALATVIDAYIKDKREIPAPSTVGRKPRVTVPALIRAKVQLYEAMRTAGVGKAALARRLDWHLPQVDRLFEMTHSSRLDQLEAAFRALGKRLVVGVEEIPNVRREPGGHPPPAGSRPRRKHGQARAARRRFSSSPSSLLNPAGSRSPNDA